MEIYRARPSPVHGVGWFFIGGGNIPVCTLNEVKTHKYFAAGVDRYHCSESLADIVILITHIDRNFFATRDGYLSLYVDRPLGPNIDN